jgi:hypothetical protein
MKETNNSDLMEFFKIALLVIKIFAFAISCNQEVATPKPHPIKFVINSGINIKDDPVLLKIKERIKEKDSLRKLKNKIK